MEKLEIPSRFFKNHNFPSLSWIWKDLQVYTAQDQHFQIQILNLKINWEKLCPSLSFTVENKMGNSSKKGWSHFKLNINDWDILLSKISRIYQWIGKNIFHRGKWNKPIRNSAHTTEYLAKRLSRCLSLDYTYVYVNIF